MELAKCLAVEVVTICGSDEVSWPQVDHSAKKLLEVLLKEYFKECWNIFGEACLSKDWQLKYHLGSILGVGGEKEKGEALIAEISQEHLLEWCGKNVPHGPAAIAYLTPLFSSDEGKESMHPLMRSLVDNFGDIDEVRGELHSNLWSFVSTGSRAPYYQRRINLLKELLEHPIEAVDEWARANMKWLEKERDQANRESEEWEWGIG